MTNSCSSCTTSWSRASTHCFHRVVISIIARWWLLRRPKIKQKNYFDKGQFFFNVYKTKGTYKQQVIDAPAELNDILKLWKKFKPKSEYLLVKLPAGDQYKPTEMTGLLKKVFKNDAMGVSVLRNVFLSDKYSDTMAGLKKDTEQMGTSVGVANSTYIK